jgi:hypothetical protein
MKPYQNYCILAGEKSWVAGYRIECGSILCRCFYPRFFVQINAGIHSASYATGSSGVKRSDRQANHSTLCSPRMSVELPLLLSTTRVRV